MPAKITHIKARQILDSRGNPTIEVDVYAGKTLGRASVPSGASTGMYEALELRDETKHYHGKNVLMAVHNINSLIAKKLIGKDVTHQKEIDDIMLTIDGTENKSRLGANTLLGISLASARCAAASKGLPLYAYLGKSKLIPTPFANIINGGKHADNNLRIQEFMVVPVKAKDFNEATMMISEVYHTLHDLIQNKYGKGAANVGDEGGFTPPLYDPHDAINLILKAIYELGYQGKIKLALDAAASEFYDRKVQKYAIEAKKMLDRNELTDYYLNLIKLYPIVSLEDPFEQDDFHSFQELMRRAKHIQIVGDDLLATNPHRIREAIQEKLCNALLLKVNQIGTLSEALDAASIARKQNWNVQVSHRSGETEDAFIADLTVGLGYGQIKLGAPARGERTAKYNQLLRIEEELGTKGKLAEFKN